jgi:hypothetical protein
MHLSRIKTAILATLIVCLCVIQRSEGAGSGQTEEEKILQVQKEMTKASLDGNATGFVKHLADGYTSTQANGTVLSREEVRKRRTSGKLKISSLVLSDQHIQIRGDSAVANFKTIVKSEWGSRGAAESRWLEEFVHYGRDGFRAVRRVKCLLANCHRKNGTARRPSLPDTDPYPRIWRCSFSNLRKSNCVTASSAAKTLTPVFATDSKLRTRLFLLLRRYSR